MTDQPIYTSGSFITILIVVLVVMGFLGFINIYAQGFSYENLQSLGLDLIPPVEQGSIESESAGNVMAEIEAGPGQTADRAADESFFMTPTHIGCDIALAIRDDFSLNGDDKKTRKQAENSQCSRGSLLGGTECPENLEFQDLRRFDANYYIVHSNTFWITADSSEGTKSFINSLNADEKDRLENLCNDREGEAGYSLKNSPCGGKLDEACVTNVLYHLKSGDRPICGKIRVSSGAEVEFGNKNCGSSNYNNIDCSICSASSAGPDKINGFRQEGKDKSSDNIALALQSNYGTGPGKFIPTECDTYPCQAKYRYALLYNKGNDKNYEVEVLKVPESIGEDRGDREFVLTNIAESITKADRSPAIRTSIAGYKYPDVRKIFEYQFSLNEEVGFENFVKGFAEKFKEKTGQKWDPVYNDNTPCVGDEDCLEKEPMKVKYKETLNQKIYGGVIVIVNHDIGERLRVWNVRTNVISDNRDLNQAKLAPGKLYKAVVFSWKGDDIVEHPTSTGSCGANFGLLWKWIWCYDKNDPKKGFTGKCGPSLLECDQDTGCFQNECSNNQFYRYIDQTLVIMEVGGAEVD